MSKHSVSWSCHTKAIINAFNAILQRFVVSLQHCVFVLAQTVVWQQYEPCIFYTHASFCHAEERRCNFTYEATLEELCRIGNLESTFDR